MGFSVIEYCELLYYINGNINTNVKVYSKLVALRYLEYTFTFVFLFPFMIVIYKLPSVMLLPYCSKVIVMVRVCTYESDYQQSKFYFQIKTDLVFSDCL